MTALIGHLQPAVHSPPTFCGLPFSYVAQLHRFFHHILRYSHCYSHPIGTMATLSNIASMNGAATAHVDVSPTENVKADAVPVTPQQHGSTALPADGMVLADTTAYRTVNHGLLSHTAGVVSLIMIAYRR